jgi:CRISPR-associated protein Csd2
MLFIFQTNQMLITNQIKTPNRQTRKIKMKKLSKKVDFAIIFTVNKANPNGDPLNENRPRINEAGYGEVSYVCLKRKMRDRLQEMGEPIFVQSDNRRIDDYTTLRERADGEIGEVMKAAVEKDIFTAACEKWLDVRAFGQLFAYKGKEKKSKKSEAEDSDEDLTKGVSIGVRGPITVRDATSVEQLVVCSNQITKSVSGEKAANAKSKASDTMGMKHRIDSGVYVAYGSVNAYLAEKTGFSDADLEKFKLVLPRLFENDESSARPSGSMAVLNVVWCEQIVPKISSKRIQDAIVVDKDGNIDVSGIPSDIKLEIIEGF